MPSTYSFKFKDTFFDNIPYMINLKAQILEVKSKLCSIGKKKGLQKNFIFYFKACRGAGPTVSAEEIYEIYYHINDVPVDCCPLNDQALLTLGSSAKERRREWLEAVRSS